MRKRRYQYEHDSEEIDFSALVPVGKTIYDSNGLFVLNELGAFIWELLPEVKDEAEICEAILREYDVSAEEAAKDVAEFIGKLREMDIV